MSSKYDVINRTVYSFGDMFGQIGGMDSIMMSILSFIVGIFSTKIYSSSLLSSFYHVVSKPKPSKVITIKKLEETKIIPLETLKKLKFDESEINFASNNHIFCKFILILNFIKRF